MKWLALAIAIMTATVLYNGRRIRAELSMMGEGWDRLHPEVQRRAMKVLEQARAAGLNVGVFEGWRDADRQRQLMKKGTSWVGDVNNSYHRWGLAVDFVFLDALGRWTWDPEGGREAWEKLGRIIEANGFEWGGRFRTFDGPHAQLPLFTIAQLKQQYESPEVLSWA
jgi:hypothetical protein